MTAVPALPNEYVEARLLGEGMSGALLKYEDCRAYAERRASGDAWCIEGRPEDCAIEGRGIAMDGLALDMTE